MDFSLLSSDEINDFLRYHHIEPTVNNTLQAQQLFNEIYARDGSNGQYTTPIIDLYIASQLDLTVPAGYDPSKLSSSSIIEIASNFALPTEDTPEVRTRIARIIRFLPKQRMTIVPVQYRGTNKYGDFAWMIRQPENSTMLFLYNDNQELFVRFQQYLADPTLGPGKSCNAGGGNAIIRPYQCRNPPLAAGIPTGTRAGGYTNLATAQPYIDAAFEYIKRLLASRRYDRVAYSADIRGNLGTMIFNVSEEVKQYIVRKIHDLSK